MSACVSIAWVWGCLAMQRSCPAGSCWEQLGCPLWLRPLVLVIRNMSQLSRMSWRSLLIRLASWQALSEESSLVSGARGGPLESRNALEVFLPSPLHMLNSVRPISNMNMWPLLLLLVQLCLCSGHEGKNLTATPTHTLVCHQTTVARRIK